MRHKDEEEAIEIEGVRLTHPQRVLYGVQGITKHDLARYYVAVAPSLLPHVAHRPLSLVRCPRGEGGSCFFQKHFAEGLPEALRGVAIEEKETRGTYAVAEDLRGLLALVQISVLELHPWGATIDRLERPDLMIFDLDPDQALPWEAVTEAALAMRRLLEDIDLKGFAKTTGGKGLHVVVPLRPERSWEEVKAVALALAERLVATAPDRYTTALPKKDRRGHIFIDYLRNSRGQTAIAPFSPRARAGAPVATPVSWEEVTAGIRSDAFTLATVPPRLAADPWAEMPKLKQRLSAALLRKLGILA